MVTPVDNLFVEGPRCVDRASHGVRSISGKAHDGVILGYGRHHCHVAYLAR